MNINKSFKMLLLILMFVGVASAKTMNITTSFTVLQDITKNIAGDKVHIDNLVGYDQDPHEFELKPHDMVLLKNSDIVVVNGLGLESWTKVVPADKLLVVNDGVNPMRLDGKIDPHTWQDPYIVEQFYVKNILKKLIAADPDNASYYKNNALDYITKLEKLNYIIKREISFIPQEYRYIVTTHDAFSYFAKRYDLQFISLQGVSTDSEPAAKDMAKLESYIRASKAKIVFLENMSNSKLMEKVIADTGATLGGKLYADGLSKTNSIDSYLKMMWTNTNTMLAVYYKAEKNKSIKKS